MDYLYVRICEKLMSKQLDQACVDYIGVVTD
jgi:hypothetical protein